MSQLYCRVDQIWYSTAVLYDTEWILIRTCEVQSPNLVSQILSAYYSSQIDGVNLVDKFDGRTWQTGKIELAKWIIWWQSLDRFSSFYSYFQHLYTCTRYNYVICHIYLFSLSEPRLWKSFSKTVHTRRSYDQILRFWSFPHNGVRISQVAAPHSATRNWARCHILRPLVEKVPEMLYRIRVWWLHWPVGQSHRLNLRLSWKCSLLSPSCCVGHNTTVSDCLHHIFPEDVAVKLWVGSLAVQFFDSSLIQLWFKKSSTSLFGSWEKFRVFRKSAKLEWRAVNHFNVSSSKNFICTSPYNRTTK